MDLQKASADEMRKSVYENYTVFIRSLLTSFYLLHWLLYLKLSSTRTISITDFQNRTAVGCLIPSSSWYCSSFERFEL